MRFYYLLFIIFLISCSSGADDLIDDSGNNVGDSDPPKPIGIKFTLNELWAPKLKFSTDSDTRKICTFNELITSPKVQSDLTGFESGKAYHYSLDTLIVEYHKYSRYFDFKITNRIEGIPAPKRIGHIEIRKVGGVEIQDDYALILETWLIEEGESRGGGFPIKYFTSNLEDELIQKISYDQQGRLTCNNLQIFEKVNTNETFRKSTEIRPTVNYDEKNLALKVGDSIGDAYPQNEKGGGWSSQFNRPYIIVAKELVY